jgi:hypothetical protein
MKGKCNGIYITRLIAEPFSNFTPGGHMMKKIANKPIRLFSYTLLCALTIPITATATMQEQVTVGDQSLETAIGACSKATNIDRITQDLNHAKSELLKRNSPSAKKTLKQAYTELQNLKKDGSGAASERIIITHGPQIERSGYLDTANAYYSPDMQDMRLLRMAESNLKAGNNQAACSVLSAVRFPYVSAIAQFSVSKTDSVAHHALTNLQSHKFDNAMANINNFTVKTATYASIFQQ